MTKAQLQAEVERLTAEAAYYRRQWEEEQARQPAEGVWLVQRRDGGTHWLWLGEVPEPLPFAAIARHQAALSQAVRRCWAQYRAQGQQAPYEVAAALIHALAEAEGVAVR